ncbi:DNA-methyltransferase [Acinetobacter baumannii]
MKHESFEPKGSFYMLNGNVQLGHGDCLELMKSIPDGSVDLILTDPPYGKTACKWDSVIPFEQMWAELKRIIKPNGAIVLFGSEPFSSMLRCSNLKMFKYDWVWVKSQAVGHLNAWKQPMRNTETISVFYKKQVPYQPLLEDKPLKNIRQQTKRTNRSECYGSHNLSIFKCPADKTMPKRTVYFNNEQRTIHPTQKPVSLLEYLIKTYTQEGETVLDFTMGSGSTGVAALNTKRKFIGIELDDNYFNIAKERISCVMQSDLQ